MGQGRADSVSPRVPGVRAAPLPGLLAFHNPFLLGPPGSGSAGSLAVSRLKGSGWSPDLGMDLVFLFPHLTRSRNVARVCAFLPISTALPSPLAWSLHGPSLLALTLRLERPQETWVGSCPFLPSPAGRVPALRPRLPPLLPSACPGSQTGRSLPAALAPLCLLSCPPPPVPSPRPL